MDWPKLIADLQAAQVTQAQIASACGVAQSTVSELARIPGREPGFDFGTRLIALHKLRTKAPRRREVDRAAANGHAEPSRSSPSYMNERGKEQRKDPLDMTLRRFSTRRASDRIG